jgi:hypothetical protein
MAENAKQQLKIDANREVVALICHKLQKQNLIGEEEFGEVHLEKCMVEIFASLTDVQHDAFIFAHDTNYHTKTSLPAKQQREHWKKLIPILIQQKENAFKLRLIVK